jgi:hypothetical protein
MLRLQMLMIKPKPCRRSSQGYGESCRPFNAALAKKIPAKAAG